MTFTERVPERAIADCVEAGVTSFKLYMAYPELLQVDDDVIVDVMLRRTRHGGLVTLHCENGGAIEALRRQALAAGRTGVLEHARDPSGDARGRGGARGPRRSPRWPARRCTSCTCRRRRRSPRCARRSERGVDVSWRRRARSTSTSTPRGSTGPDGEIVRLHAAAARPVARRGAVARHGDRRGAHRRHRPLPVQVPTAAPASPAAPDGWADFTEIPGGLPGIETRLGLVWEGVAAGRITAADWVRLCAEAPARTFGLWPAQGQPARRVPTPTSSCGTRSARQSLGRERPAHERRPLALRGRRPSPAGPTLVLSRGRRRRARRARSSANPARVATSRAAPSHRLARARGRRSARDARRAAATRRAR